MAQLSSIASAARDAHHPSRSHPASASTADRREISGLVVAAALAYCERAAGPDVRDRAVERAGLGDRLQAEEPAKSWFTTDEVVGLAEAISHACGEPAVGRRIGEEQVLLLCEFGLRDMLRAQGTVAAAMELVLNAGMKMSYGRSFTIVEREESRLVIDSVTHASDAMDPLFCEYVHGVFATVASVLGVVGRVIEPACQARGAASCRFTLSWSDDPRSDPVQLDADVSASRFEERLASFEYMQAMASDLLGSHELEDVLDRICDHATRTLTAHRFLLAVEVGAGSRLRVHQRGFDDEALAREYAEKLVTGATEIDGETVLTSVIASGGRSHGVLAVFSIPEAKFTSWESRTMDAYARHAAAALDIVAALDGAERDRDTAQALLGLAAELASVGTQREIADRLTTSVTSVTNCDVAMLWDWDAAGEVMRARSYHHVDGIAWPGPNDLNATELPQLLDVAASPQPLLLRREDVPPPLQALFEPVAVELAAVMPIVSRGALMGVLTAGYGRPPSHDEQIHHVATLHGLAAHAATALENARLLEDISHQASHDALTGLPNRPLVQDRANAALGHAAASATPTSLLFLDLDRFKIVNDTLGHSAGDALIREVGARLNRIMRSTDTLARLGGDEFVVLLPGAGVDAAVEVAERIVHALQAPFVLGENEIFISSSIGVATAPVDGDSYDELMRVADTAMYRAKAAGRNGIALAVEVADDDRRRERLELESALHRAIDQEELRVLYQPRVDVVSGRVTGVEALVRWQHPSRGLLPPADFLEVAEDSGLVVDIDAFVRRTAFAQAARWAERGLQLRVAVNLSTRDVYDPRLPELIAAEIAEAGVDAALVELEVTDRVAMSDDDDLPAVLGHLKALGVRLAIDDFGTGTSVLGRLQRCPVDTLKIDRSFVRDIVAGSADELVVRALVALGRSLDLEVVAEGVEEQEQRYLLEQCGCERAQGYLFSRPVDADAIVALAGRSA